MHGPCLEIHYYSVHGGAVYVNLMSINVIINTNFV